MIHTIIPSLVLLLLIAAASWFFSKRGRKNDLVWLANGLLVNTRHWGAATFLVNPAQTLSQRYLVVSRDLPDGTQYVQAFSGTTLMPFGVARDMTPATDTAPSDYPIEIDVLGSPLQSTLRMVAGAAIAADVLVYAATGGTAGTVLSLAVASAGTYWVVGRSLTAANALNDLIEVIGYQPYQVTVA